MTTPTREQVLGFRVRAQGLDRRKGGTDAVLRFGVQDTPTGSAAAALAARGVLGTEDELGQVTVWSWRGAPHRHHRDDPLSLAAALWPVNDDDARARIAVGRIKAGAARGVEAFTQVATAMREAVTESVRKGEVSTAVSARIPRDLGYHCEPCQAWHVAGIVFQQVGLAAGVRVRTQGRSTYLEPLPDDARPPAVPERAEGTADALRRYLAVMGPAGAPQFASLLGTTQSAIKPVLGTSQPSLPRAAAARLGSAERPRLTRLLPPSDPWLQDRDREFIVPDPHRRSALWKATGSPGALLVDGEILGTWRARAGKRLSITVTPFEPLARHAVTDLDEEAALLSAARGAHAYDITVTD